MSRVKHFIISCTLKNAIDERILKMPLQRLYVLHPSKRDRKKMLLIEVTKQKIHTMRTSLYPTPRVCNEINNKSSTSTLTQDSSMCKKQC